MIYGLSPLAELLINSNQWTNKNVMLCFWVINTASSRQVLADQLSRGPSFKKFTFQNQILLVSEDLISVNERRWSATRKFLVLLKWRDVDSNIMSEMNFLESFIKEVLTHDTFSIKSVQVYVVNKMCDFFLSFLIKTSCRQS